MANSADPDQLVTEAVISLCWAYISKNMFSHIGAHIMKFFFRYCFGLNSAFYAPAA